MKNRLIKIGLVALGAMGIMAGCSKASKTGVEGVKERGKLIMGVDDQFAPMGFRDIEGNIVGFDVDLATAIADRMGVELEIQPIPWSAKETMLNQGDIDVIWNGYTITEAREEVVLFTEPYLENSQIIIVRKDSGIETIEDLAGKRVGTQLASSSEDAIAKNPEALESFEQLVKYDDNMMLLKDLGIGGVDAAVMDEVVARYQLKVNGYDYVILEEDFGKEEYGIGVRKEDETLAEELNKQLQQVREDGTYDSISKKWFSE